MSAGTLCPSCGKSGAKCFDSRRTKGRYADPGAPKGYTWRRSECAACKHRWTTIEIPVEEFDDLTRLKGLAAGIYRLLAETEAKSK